MNDFIHDFAKLPRDIQKLILSFYNNSLKQELLTYHEKHKFSYKTLMKKFIYFSTKNINTSYLTAICETCGNYNNIYYRDERIRDYMITFTYCRLTKKLHTTSTYNVGFLKRYGGVQLEKLLLFNVVVKQGMNMICKCVLEFANNR